MNKFNKVLSLIFGMNVLLLNNCVSAMEDDLFSLSTLCSTKSDQTQSSIDQAVKEYFPKFEKEFKKYESQKFADNKHFKKIMSEGNKVFDELKDIFKDFSSNEPNFYSYRAEVKFKDKMFNDFAQANNDEERLGIINKYLQLGNGDGFTAETRYYLMNANDKGKLNILNRISKNYFEQKENYKLSDEMADELIKSSNDKRIELLGRYLASKGQVFNNLEELYNKDGIVEDIAYYFKDSPEKAFNDYKNAFLFAWGAVNIISKLPVNQLACMFTHDNRCKVAYVNDNYTNVDFDEDYFRINIRYIKSNEYRRYHIYVGSYLIDVNFGSNDDMSLKIYRLPTVYGYDRVSMPQRSWANFLFGDYEKM